MNQKRNSVSVSTLLLLNVFMITGGSLSTIFAKLMSSDVVDDQGVT